MDFDAIIHCIVSLLHIIAALLLIVFLVLGIGMIWEDLQEKRYHQINVIEKG